MNQENKFLLKVTVTQDLHPAFSKKKKKCR